MDFEGPAQSFVDEIIICENVHKWFGEFEALRGIDIMLIGEGRRQVPKYDVIHHAGHTLF